MTTDNREAPVLIVENLHGHGIPLSKAIRLAALTNPLLRLSDAASAELYLSGAGEFSDRKKYPLPCLVLFDVTLPQLTTQMPSWLQSAPVCRHIVVTSVTAPLDPSQFESAEAFGPNSVLCKLSSDESLAALMNVLREIMIGREEPSLAAC